VLGVVVGVTPPGDRRDDNGGGGGDDVTSPLASSAERKAAGAGAAPSSDEDANTYAVALADGTVRRNVPRKRLQGKCLRGPIPCTELLKIPLFLFVF
jgi:hypothetical protein